MPDGIDPQGEMADADRWKPRLPGCDLASSATGWSIAVVLNSILGRAAYHFFLRRDGLHPQRYRRLLDRTQRMSLDELEALRLARLKSLVQHCYQHNSFYRKRFSATGFEPGDLRDFTTLQRLPVLTKEDIRAAGTSLFSEGFDARNTLHKRTGGSTGIPLHLYWDFDGASFKRAGSLRHDSWAGWVPGVHRAAVWGDTDKPQSLKETIRCFLSDRVFYLDTLKFDDEHILRFLNQVRARRPEILMGHAHSVFRLAEYVQNAGMTGFRFRGIVTTAMVLEESERRLIEDVFMSPVFNRYGCEEVGLIASECPAHQGMHVFAEGLHLELLDPEEATPRPLIITDLVNMAMPLIRYEIADCAVALPGLCPCGRTLPRLKEVAGRTADFLFAADRRRVFGVSILDTFVIHIPGFKQVQIIQDQYDHLHFRIIRDPAFSDSSLRQLATTVHDVFGPAMHHDVEFVDKIELTASGKFRFSICMIPEEQTHRDGAHS
jgi:phenylacetate-CoA ligase